MRKIGLRILLAVVLLAVSGIVGWRAYFSPQGLLGPSGIYRHDPQPYNHKYEYFRIFRENETKKDREYVYKADDLVARYLQSRDKKDFQAYYEKVCGMYAFAVVELVITDCIGFDNENNDKELLYADDILEARVTRVVCQREQSALRPGDMIAFAPKSFESPVQCGNYPVAVKPGDRYVMILEKYGRWQLSMTKAMHAVTHVGYHDIGNSLFMIPMRLEGLRGYQPDMRQMADFFEDESMLNWKWEELCRYFQDFMDKHLYYDYIRQVYLY